MKDGRCYYKVLKRIPISQDMAEDFQQTLENQTVHEAFKNFMGNLKEIYDLMAKVDRMLFDSGFELPWSDLKLRPIIHEAGEKVYEKGETYVFYRDIREITALAKSRVLLIDAYPDEEVLDLYLDKIPVGIAIRVLTNKPQGNFLTVAQKFKQKPGVSFEVRASKDCHDRLFFVDDACWVMGQSLKDAGKKPTYLVKIESQALFNKVFEDLWAQAQSLL
jgi:hypothetical protein